MFGKMLSISFAPSGFCGRGGHASRVATNALAYAFRYRAYLRDLATSARDHCVVAARCVRSPPAYTLSSLRG